MGGGYSAHVEDE